MFSLLLAAAAAAAKSLQSCLKKTQLLYVLYVLVVGIAICILEPTCQFLVDSLRPYRWQPTRLPRPWDSPGKNTGVGCHFLLQCRKVKSESEVTQSCLTLGDPMDCSPPGSSIHGILQARVLESGAIAFSTLLLELLCNPGHKDLHLYLLLRFLLFWLFH